MCEAITATWFAWEKERWALRKRRMCERAVCSGRVSWRAAQAKGLVSRTTTRREALSSACGSQMGGESREEMRTDGCLAVAGTGVGGVHGGCRGVWGGRAAALSIVEPLSRELSVALSSKRGTAWESTCGYKLI